MSPRRYVSPARAAAAAATRARVIEAATTVLRHGARGSFSLDEVAAEAGVTRLTVYNQFGSRGGLLEAVFDEIARQRGLTRIHDALSRPDPLAGLDHLVDIFCELWSGEPALDQLYRSAGSDPELEQAFLARNERRRGAVGTLVDRIAGGRVSPAARRDMVDLIFALTSYPMFRLLRDGRKPGAVGRLIKTACREAVGRATSMAGRRGRQRVSG